MDEQRFAAACERVTTHPRQRGGIGTLSEKTLHAVLKHYYEPDAARHEVPIAGYVADILRPEGIVEIQTGSFAPLRQKLAAFLPSWPVTVVHPVAHTRHLCWLDPHTGEITPPRRTPTRGSVYTAVPNLYEIKPLLVEPNLTICIALLEIEEYKYLNGYGRQRKIRAGRAERIPRAMVQEVYLGGEYGFSALIPEGLPAEFTTADFALAAGVHQKTASTALTVLHHVGAVRRVGKRGRAYLYEL